MFDRTETLCVGAGLAAVGLLFNAHHFTERITPRPSACSARAAQNEAVSSRAAAVEGEEEEDFLSDIFNQPVSENFDESMSGMTMPNGGPHTEATRRNLAAVQTQLSLEPTFGREIGSTPLIAGRAPVANAAPKVSGGLFLNIPEKYAEQLYDA